MRIALLEAVVDALKATLEIEAEGQNAERIHEDAWWQAARKRMGEALAKLEEYDDGRQ